MCGRTRSTRSHLRAAPVLLQGQQADSPASGSRGGRRYRRKVTLQSHLRAVELPSQGLEANVVASGTRVRANAARYTGASSPLAAISEPTGEHGHFRSASWSPIPANGVGQGPSSRLLPGSMPGGFAPSSSVQVLFPRLVAVGASERVPRPAVEPAPLVTDPSARPLGREHPAVRKPAAGRRAKRG